MTSRYRHAPLHLAQDNARTHSQKGYGEYHDNQGASMRSASQYTSAHAPGMSWQSFHAQASPSPAPLRQSNAQASQQSGYGRGFGEAQAYQAGPTNFPSALNQHEHDGMQNVPTNGHNMSAGRGMTDPMSSHGLPAYQAPQMHHQQAQTHQAQPPAQSQAQPQYKGHPQYRQSQSAYASSAHDHQQLAPANPRPAHTSYQAAATTLPKDAQQQPVTTQYLHALRQSQTGDQYMQQHEQSNSAQGMVVGPGQQQSGQHVASQHSTPQTPFSHTYASASQTVDPNQVYNQRHELERAAAAPQAEAEVRSRARVSTSQNEQTPNGDNSNAKSQSKSRGSQGQEAPEASSEADDMSAAIALMHTANASNSNDSGMNKEALEAQMMEMFKKMREFNKKDPDMLARLWNQERSQHLAESNQSSTPTPQQSLSQKRKNASQQSAAAEKRSNLVNVTEPPRQDTVSPTVTSQVPDISKAGSKIAVGTVWPPEKKGLLAKAAVRYINEDARNQGKEITAAEVSTILDTNPRYVELCQQIEAKGIVINRGTFAKYLLSAVPGPKGIRGGTSNMQTDTNRSTAAEITAAEEDPNPAPVSSSQTKSKSRTPHGRKRKGSTTLATPAEKTTRKASPKGTATRAGASGNIDPALDGLDAVKAFVDQPETPSSASTSKVKGARGKGRQRSSIDVSTTPQPKSKEELARKRKFEDLVDLTLLSESEEEVLYPPEKRQEISEVISSLPSPPQTDLDKAAQAAGNTSATDKIDPENIGPRASKIPDIAAILRSSRPSYPQEASSLPSTTLQPAVQTAPPAQMQANPLPQSIMEQQGRNRSLVCALDKSKAFRRSEYDARTIARDVLLACGRHPVLRPLNYHLEILKLSVPAISILSDLDTINWDIIDPGGPPPGSGAQIRPGGLPDLGNEADDEDDDNDDSVVGKGDKDGRQATGAAASKVKVMGPAITHSSMKKKKKKHAADRLSNNFGQSHTTPQSKSRPSGTPKTASPGAGSGGYAALRQVDENGNPIKKKGRPVGWRKWMQKTPDSSGKAPAGVKSKKPDPEPRFHMYKCEWRDCGALLHNLVTLRTHVLKLHCNRTLENVLPCLWLNCGVGETVTDPSTGRTSSEFRLFKFPDRNDWVAHIDKAHISPIAWKHGDGPAAGVSDRDSELSDAYLSDKQGRQVTPRIVMPDDAGGSSSTRPVKRTAEEEAQLEQDKATRRKRDAGLGVDKGGARLANEKRRLGFIDNATEARIIDDDDDEHE